MGIIARSLYFQAHIDGSIYFCPHGFIRRSQQAHDKIGFYANYFIQFYD
jgi:hypothetical protein